MLKTFLLYDTGIGLLFALMFLLKTGISDLREKGIWPYQYGIAQHGTWFTAFALACPGLNLILLAMALKQLAKDVYYGKWRSGFDESRVPYWIGWWGW